MGFSLRGEDVDDVMVAGRKGRSRRDFGVLFSETRRGVMAQKGTKDGLGEVARFNTPTQIAVSSTGVLYVSDSGNHTLRQIGLDGTMSTLTGL